MSVVTKGDRNVRSGKQLNKMKDHQWTDENLAVDLPEILSGVVSLIPSARVTYVEFLNTGVVHLDIEATCETELSDDAQSALKNFCATILVDGSAGFEYEKMFVAQKYNLNASDFEIEITA